MGKVHRKAVLRPCPACFAETNQPCVHKTTGKPIKKLHKSRTYGPRNELLNKEVERIARVTNEEFLEWAKNYLGIDNGYCGEF